MAISGVADDLPYGKARTDNAVEDPWGLAGFHNRRCWSAIAQFVLKEQFQDDFADRDDEITVRVSKVMRNSGTAALRNFELKSPAGEFVPLSEVVSLTERQGGFAAIERIDGKATVSVTADIDTKVSTTEKAIEELEASNLQQIADRFGISYRYSGRDEERRKAFCRPSNWCDHRPGCDLYRFWLGFLPATGAR